MVVITYKKTLLIYTKNYWLTKYLSINHSSTKQLDELTPVAPLANLVFMDINWLALDLKSFPKTLRGKVLQFALEQMAKDGLDLRKYSKQQSRKWWFRVITMYQVFKDSVYMQCACH